MPGKRKATASSADPQPKAKAKAALALVPPPPVESLGVNADLQAHLASCDAMIKAHYGAALEGDATSACGAEPFNKKVAADRLASHGKYQCAVPFYAIDTMFEMQPNVPRYRTRIEALRDHFFQTPRFIEDPIVVHVEPEQFPEGKFRGVLQPVSAPEMRDALRMAIAQDIERKASKATLKGWLEILMSTFVRFEVHSANKLEKVFSVLVQGREDVCVKCENTRTSSLLRVYEIMEFRKLMQSSPSSHDKKKGAVNAKELVEAYQKIKFSKMSEPVSGTFIEYAITFHNSALQFPEIARVLQHFDQLPANPMDSIYKYRLVMNGCDKNREKMLWVYSFLFDHYHNVVLKKARPGSEIDSKWVKDSISVRSLQDGSAEHVSYVKLFLQKRSLRDALLKMMDASFGAWDNSIRTEIRRITETLATARETLGFLDGGAETQKPFPARSTWPQSADLFLLILEAFVFGYEHDEAFCANIRNHKSAEDLLEHPDKKTV